MVNKKESLFYAIVPASGVGSRMKANIPKQYLKIHNKTILEHTVEKLIKHPCIDKVIVAISNEDPYFRQTSLASHPSVIKVIGGKDRSDSVFSGLSYLVNECDASDSWVLVHDAVRPCVRNEDINHLIDEASSSSVGGILAIPVRDTMKRGNQDTSIIETVERTNLWHALTPQMFKVGLLYHALSAAINVGNNITDEASAIEHLGLKPKLVLGKADNIKITQPEDLALAAFYLSKSYLNRQYVNK